MGTAWPAQGCLRSPACTSSLAFGTFNFWQEVCFHSHIYSSMIYLSSLAAFKLFSLLLFFRSFHQIWKFSLRYFPPLLISWPTNSSPQDLSCDLWLPPRETTSRFGFSLPEGNSFTPHVGTVVWLSSYVSLLSGPVPCCLLSSVWKLSFHIFHPVFQLFKAEGEVWFLLLHHCQKQDYFRAFESQCAVVLTGVLLSSCYL